MKYTSRVTDVSTMQISALASVCVVCLSEQNVLFCRTYILSINLPECVNDKDFTERLLLTPATSK